MNSIKILCVGVVLTLVACGGADSRKEKYLNSGNEHYQNDDCKKAKLEYKNALQVDPKTPEALIGLSRCAIESKEWKNAYGLLINALDIDPNAVDAKNDLAKIYLITGDTAKAYELIDEVLELEPNNASALALRGIFHLKNNTLPAARTDSEKSLSIEKNNLTAITLLSSISVKSGETNKAVNYIEQQLLDDGLTKRKRRELYFMSAALYRQLEDTDKLIKTYKKLIELYPNDNTYTYRLAAVYANDGKVDQAEKILLENLDSTEDKIGHITFIEKYKSVDEATEKLKNYAEDGNGRLNLALARRYMRQNNNNLALPILEDLATRVTNPVHLEAKNDIALLALKNKDIDKTSVLVEEVLSEQPNNIRALLMRGSLAISQRDAPVAIADFRTVLRDQPTNTYAVRQLAIAYVMNDQKELAKELLQKAVAIDSNNKELGLLYARLQGADQNFESAIDTINMLNKDEPGDLETIKTLFDLQIANQDYVGAKQTAESMKSTVGDNPLGYYLSGVLLQNEDNSTGAEEQYILALDKEPRATEPLSGLIRLYLSQKNPSKAIAFLEKNIDRDPEYLVPYNLLGEVYISNKDYNSAIESFNSAIEINKEWWIPYRGISLAYLAQGDKKSALEILEQGYERGAGPERLGVELANIYYQQGDRNKAINIYKDVIKKVPTSIVSKNNLAMLMVDEEGTQAEAQEALKYAAELESIGQPASLDTAGWVYYKSGDIQKAIEILEKAVALAPNAGELHYHLGMAYSEEVDNIERAKQHLKIAAESEQEFRGKQIAIEKLNSLTD